MLYDNIIGKEFSQNCGDSLLVLEKTNKKQIDTYLYLCKFKKYPYEVLALKQRIIRGQVNNPQIEKVEFIDKIWPQNCGDSLKIIEKTNKKGYWKCEFLKYPYKIEAIKQSIINGLVINPQIEQVEFIGKIFPQNCGDSLKVIEKTNIKDNNNAFLFKCEFIKYPCEILSEKKKIKEGNVDNLFLPYKSKCNLQKYIQENFKEKPTLQELAKSLNIAICTIGHKINEFCLRDYIKYYPDNFNKEQDLRNYIYSLNNSFSKESCWTELNGKEIDIYSPNLKLGIEFNGNYWHSELYKFPNYHQEKSLLAKEKGIQLVHIWEWEYEQKEDLIKSFIKSKLSIFEKKIFARKCQIKELNNQAYQDFCNKNHLQGECGAKIKLGLFFKEELVQIMSFGVPRFTNEFEYEIIRECSKQGYIIFGGKEKLWSYFIKNYNPNSVISYCDFSKFTGNSYLKLGFKKERLNKPGFVWWDSKINQIFWRNPYKHKDMKEKGYLKIYDAGQLVFIWNKENS